MQRILNDPDNIVDEMLSGFLKANSDIVEATENKRVVKARCKGEGKVGVITGGGSGHKPAFIGYVGENMCDAAAVGEICSSPTAVAFLDAAKCADQGKGVACLYGNYSGDNMNVKMAVKMAQKQGLTIKTVIANDDVASAPKNQREKRRGGAGVDVFEMEPPLPMDHPLLHSINTIVTPHIAFASDESMEIRAKIVFENIQKWMNKEQVNTIL